MIFIFIIALTIKTTSPIHVRSEVIKNYGPDKEFSKSIVFGQVSAVEVDDSGDVYVFHRGENKWTQESFNQRNEYLQTNKVILQPTIIVLNSKGDLITQTGQNLFFMPHGLTVDKENNVWLTDVALHQVLKFGPIVKTQKEFTLKTPLLALGQRLVPGTDNQHFCKPTSVAIDALSNDFFVADGYCNSRIMKFDKNGNFLLSWGKSSERSPFQTLGPFNLNVPHSLTINQREKQLIVADRENARIVIYSFEGKFNSTIDLRRRIYGVTYSSATDSLYGVTGDTYRFPGSGFIFSMAYNNQTAEFEPGNHFKNAHDVAVSSNGRNIYVAELDPYTVWKFSVGSEEENSKQVVPQAAKLEIANSDSVQKVLPTDGSAESSSDTKSDAAATPGGAGLNAADSMGANQLAVTVVTAIVLLAILAVSCHVYRKREKTSSMEMKGLILEDEDDRIL